jgi:dTDP-4-dehydrorhamnose reductase
MKKTLIVGKNSFIGKSFYHSTKNVDIISYCDIDTVDFSKYSVVLNCAITPEFKFEDYKQRYDLDYQVGIRSYANKCHYIMMSSRKVYGDSGECVPRYSEDDVLNPQDYYADNKVTSEKKIINLGGQHTILRASNVYGFEYERNSFMGFCMTQLKHNNTIEYSISDKIIRDFISIKSVCKILNKVVELKPQGIYNLSSNHGTEIGDVAKSLIEGYGSGKLIVTGQTIKDQFILDNTRLLKALDIELPIFQKKYIKKLGEKL